MTVIVRPPHPGELDAVGELTVTAYAADELLADDDYYTEHLRDSASRHREAEVYVAELPELPGDVVGTVTFCPQGSPWSELARPGEGEFRMLAVAPTARRRGVAEALVGVCIERATELGYTAVVLSSLPVQQAAHRIYARLGFHRTPERDWSPGTGVLLLAFRLDL
ncbi:MAG: GNAT family N-acetyltransferase [Nocardioidaceae bacterium]